MNIVILGAGVAGIAAAIALTERGHAVRVFERRPLATTLGAGVTLWPNATFVLEELGMLSAITAAGGRPRLMARFDDRGAPLGTIDIGAIDAQMGSPTISILRRELQRILLARAAALAIPVSYGRPGREVGDTGRVAWVTFDDGERVEGDLVVGADGRMASAARRYVAGTHGPVFQGFVNWVGTAETAAPIVERAHEIQDYWGVGLRFGIVPIDARRVYWAGGEAAARDEARATTPLREQVRERFAGWPEIITTIVEASAPESIRRIAVYDLEPLARWHRGRVLVVGDAAHASLPDPGSRCVSGPRGCLAARPAPAGNAVGGRARGIAARPHREARGQDATDHAGGTSPRTQLVRP